MTPFLKLLAQDLILIKNLNFIKDLNNKLMKIKN